MAFDRIGNLTGEDLDGVQPCHVCGLTPESGSLYEGLCGVCDDDRVSAEIADEAADEEEVRCEVCGLWVPADDVSYGACESCASIDEDAEPEPDIDCDVCEGSGRVLKGEDLGMTISLHADDGGKLGDQTEDCGACCGHGVVNW